MPSYSLTSFEIQKDYQNEPKFNGAYSRNNLHKIKDRTDVINLDEYESKGIHSIALYVNGNIKKYLIAWKLNIFQKKLKKSYETKLS